MPLNTSPPNGVSVSRFVCRRTSAWALRKSSKPKQPKGRKHALAVRRLINDRGRYEGTVIDIRSDRLCDVLIELNDGVENLDLDRSEPQVRAPPSDAYSIS